VGKTNRKYNYENGEETITRGKAYSVVKGHYDSFELDIEAGLKEYANRKSPVSVETKVKEEGD